MKALTRIILMQHNKDERDEASQLKKCIERLEFVFLLVVMTKILGKINIASQYLQNKDCREQLITYIRLIRTYLSCVPNSTELRKKQWRGVAPTFEQKRKSKRKRHFDELAEDSRLTDPEECFRINVFYAVLDIVNSLMKQRLAAMLAVNEKFSVLNPTVLSQLGWVQHYAEGNYNCKKITRMTCRLHFQSNWLIVSERQWKLKLTRRRLLSAWRKCLLSTMQHCRLLSRMLALHYSYFWRCPLLLPLQKGRSPSWRSLRTTYAIQWDKSVCAACPY